MNIKKSTLALAVVAASTMGVSQVASADVYAGSTVEIENLNVVLTGGGLGTAITSFNFTATNTATLNGASATTGTGGTGAGFGELSQNCGGTPGAPGVGTNDCNAGAGVDRVDPGAANAPGGSVVRANNDFTLLGAPGTETFSSADSVIYQAELTGDGPTHTQQIAESELQGSGAGNSNAEITSSTGFVMNFNVEDGGAGTGTLAVSFEATPFLEALIQALAFQNGNAQANINSTFSLTDASGNQITWSPQGTAGSDCDVDPALAGVACVENADGLDLNRNLSTSSNNTDLTYNLAGATGAFGITISGLASGDWTLAFNSVTSTSVRATVPEPSLVALLGVGLLGMGFAGRRREV